jgi:dTDP-glucose 4,6-dehydratase
MSKKRVLVTGAAGFLGSHLCDRFIKEGYYVIGMDNLITGDLRNIEHLFPNPDFEFYHHDVSKYIHIPGELHYIMHFASPASPIDYLKIPIQTLKVVRTIALALPKQKMRECWWPLLLKCMVIRWCIRKPRNTGVT